MREIKFRAWDGRNMHKVCRLGMHGYSTDLWSPSIVPDTRTTAKLTFMQFTGLHDKNGNEIYEGDIFGWMGGYIEKVFWDDEISGWNIDKSASQTGEVIGNIYDNPELLEGK